MSASLDLFERDELEEAIDLLHDATAFYTAEPIVDQLLDMMDWPNGSRRLVDASCGDGAFLVSALRRLLAERPDVTADEIVHLVQGWEIHYFAVGEARGRLEKLMLSHGFNAHQAKATAARMVVHGDFLKLGPRAPTWDVVIGNPPFLRYANLPEILRTDYERELPEHSQGDMLHSFIDRCATTLTLSVDVSFA